MIADADGHLDSQRIPTREKHILAGLYLSKYDSLGLKALGFESFVEAFNVIGYAMGSLPASIKNYRDEFDPFFPNRRKGWHKRPIRGYCLKVFEGYKGLDYVLENTTRLGCGYDFRLRAEKDPDLLAVEVKGLRERIGSLSLTPKEYEVATALTDRFFLFVVKNFQESPFHEVFQNPLSGRLRFRKNERVMVHVSWVASL